MGSNLFTVADDVKAQATFNKETVKSYRLIGYENRKMSNDDFANDNKDAGEIGAGSDVVVMFEIELKDNKTTHKLFELKIRYKDPGEAQSKLLTKNVSGAAVAGTPSSDFTFSCAVAAFGHLLRGSEYTGDADIDLVMGMAQRSLGEDKGGYRQEFLELLDRYKKIK
jgi:Ca-activated chloride channel family protein